MCQALLEIMEPEINKIKQEVWEETTLAVRHNYTLVTVRCLRELGADNVKIMELLIKNHGLSTQEAEKYL